MQKFFGVSQDTSGNAIPSVTVTVNLAGTGTLATLYSDNSYTPLANPFTSATDGTYQFYSKNGRYDVVLTKTGFTFTSTETSDVLLDDDFSVISPAQITATQNDYSPTNGSNAAVWRLTSDAARTVTGIAAPTASAGALLLTITNVGSFTITFSNQSSSSSASNRILSSDGFDVPLASTMSMTLYYDQTTAVWRVLSVGPQIFSKVLARQVTTVSAENAVGPTTLYTVTIPGGTLGTTRAIRMQWAADVLANNAPGDNFTVTIRYGGTTLHTFSVAPLNNANRYHELGTMLLCAHNSTAAQIAATSSVFSGAAGNGVGQAPSATISSASGHPSVAVDSTTDQTLDFRVAWNAASNNNSYRMQNVTVELL